MLHPPAHAGGLVDAWQAARARKVLFDTGDADQAQALVARVFRPHQLVPSGGARLAARMEHWGSGLFGFSLLRYGADVRILPGPLEHFYLLQVPVAGSAEIETAGRAFRSDTRHASFISPTPDLRMRWGADNVQLCVRIEAPTLQRFLAAWCGDADVALPVFDPAVDMARQPRLQAVLAELVQAARGPALGPLPTAELQYRLLATLLATLPHDAAARLDGDGPPATPRCVRVVEDQLLEHCDEPWTPVSMAACAGVSVRSLFLGFQRHRGVSPMKLLRELRLRRVREELLASGPETRVTDVALRWGFCHLGRFSQEYRRAFGEAPGDTQRVRRAASAVRTAARAPAPGPFRPT